MEGWEEKIDQKSGLPYWKNKTTGKSQWHNPALPAVPSSKSGKRSIRAKSVSFHGSGQGSIGTTDANVTGVAGAGGVSKSLSSDLASLEVKERGAHNRRKSMGL